MLVLEDMRKLCDPMIMHNRNTKDYADLALFVPRVDRHLLDK